MALVRIVLHGENIRAFLKSEQVSNLVEPHAEGIRAAADAGLQEDGHYVHKLYGDRVSFVVGTQTAEAMVAEQTRRNLTRSVDAGRA